MTCMNMEKERVHEKQVHVCNVTSGGAVDASESEMDLGWWATRWAGLAQLSLSWWWCAVQVQSLPGMPLLLIPNYFSTFVWAKWT